MVTFICTACGTSFPPLSAPPPSCPICADERQFVPLSGQGWTTPNALEAGHANEWRALEPGLLSLHTVPKFGIGQRALLLRTPHGNVLWDCIALLDEATVTLVEGLGGLAAIAISHPHYYTTMQDWATRFGARVYLHADDRAWIMRPDPAIQLWEGDINEILPGVTMLRLGGHFPGGAVLHWAAGADGAGALLTGDIVQVTPGAARVSFLWSYPNMMPLPAASIRQITDRLRPWRYAHLYGAFPGLDIMADAEAIVARSAARCIELVSRTEPL